MNHLTEFKESVKAEKWVRDKDVTNCADCKNLFSINRRKVKHFLCLQSGE